MELFKRANAAGFTRCLPQNFSLKSQWAFYFSVIAYFNQFREEKLAK